MSWDSARAGHFSFHGYDRATTPYLSERSDDALVFADAQVSGVGTPTSFTGVFTGDYADPSSDSSPGFWRSQNETRRHLAEALEDAGYYTGAVHTNPLMSDAYGWNRGWDEFDDGIDSSERDDADADGRANQITDHVATSLRRLGIYDTTIQTKNWMRNMVTRHEGYVPWENIWDRVEAFVRDAPEPWFLWVLLLDTHHPWNAPSEYRTWRQPGYHGTYTLNYLMLNFPRLVGRRNQYIVNAYDNEMRHADAFLRTLDATLSDAGVMDETVQIIHGDHGDELGEHGFYGHPACVWDTVTRVPLLVRGLDRSGTVERPVSLRRLGSTILDLADSDERLAGAPSLFEEPEHESVVVQNRPATGADVAAAVGPSWKVVFDEFAGWSAFDRNTDPYEQKNRWGDHPDHLEKRVRDHVDDWQRPTSGDASDETASGTVQSRLEDLGYIE